MCQQLEEAAHVREIRLLRGLRTRANEKIADLECSIAELRAQHHLDVKPPLSQCSQKSYRFLKQLLPLPALSHLFLNFNPIARNPERLLVDSSEIPSLVKE
jgi:hypothetical protein